MTKQLLALIILFSGCSVAAIAQSDTAVVPHSDSVIIMKVLAPVQKFYIGGGMDGGIFSSAVIKKGSATTYGTLRFTDLVNWGISFNRNFGRHFGIFTGIDIKNIGFIEKIGGTTTKYRTYNLGVPVGIKIGNMAAKKPYLFLGGGIDAPINYREKSFQIRDQKMKFNEWFSDRTPATMPYVFAGVAVKYGITFKAQYYPNNFFNPDFTKNSIKPYAAYDVNLFLLSVGFYMSYSKPANAIKKEDVTKMNTM